MKRNRKGQAAMEFLMTYGWAILIVVIAIAALAAFGVFNRPVQEGCFMESATMACQGAIPAVNESTPGVATIQLGLRNGGAATASINSVTSSGDTGSCGTVADIDVRYVNGTSISAAAPYVVNKNQAFVLVVTCGADSYVEASDFQQSFSINYDDLDSGIVGLVARVRAVAKTQ